MPDCTDTEHHYTCPECGNPAIERVMLPCSSCLEANPRRRALPITMTCATCKHWRKSSAAFLIDDDDAKATARPHRLCTAIECPRDEEEPAPGEPFMHPTSHGASDLYTPPSFSCSLWTPKDTP
jgi:ribosomal protein L37AE/L43A